MTRKRMESVLSKKLPLSRPGTRTVETQVFRDGDPLDHDIRRKFYNQHSDVDTGGEPCKLGIVSVANQLFDLSNGFITLEFSPRAGISVRIPMILANDMVPLSNA